MELRELNLQQAGQIYEKYLIHDFPAAEVKPMSRIAQMWEDGIYKAVGIYEDDVLEGYAFFVCPKTGAYVLMDYFAVLSTIRSRGTGSRFIGLLKNGLERGTGVLIEVENPAFAQDQEELTQQERRISFYTRNGFEMTEITAKLFGVEYRVMALDTLTGEIGEREALYRGALGEIYQAMFPSKLYEKGVCIR